MTLVCITPFGHFKPGDTVTVPDGAVYDRAYFTTQEQDTEEDGEQ